MLFVIEILQTYVSVIVSDHLFFFTTMAADAHMCSRGHLGDVYDLCWSSDSRFIVSGSVDNSAIAWDTQKGENRQACFGDTKMGSWC